MQAWKADVPDACWLIEPAAYRGVLDALQAGLQPQEGAPEFVPRRTNQLTAEEAESGVLVLHMRGVIAATARQAARWPSVFGCSIEAIAAELRLASDHPSIIQMAILVIDSPGGSPNGIVQLAQRMRRYGVIAHVAGLAAGSAYWLASNLLTTQADPLAQVGCLHAKENAVWLHPDRGIGLDPQRIRNQCAFELQADRRVGPDLAERLLAGELFGANEAKAHNLIDRVATLDRARLQAFGALGQALANGFGNTENQKTGTPGIQF